MFDKLIVVLLLLVVSVTSIERVPLGKFRYAKWYANGAKGTKPDGKQNFLFLLFFLH